MRENLMIQRIQEKMREKPEPNKRQISLFLLPEKVNQLDEIVQEINETSIQKLTRSGLIELAVDVLIEDSQKILEERKQKETDEFFDLAVFPSDETGEDTLWSEKKWYYVRVDEKKISKIKYIAIYLGAPYSRIHYYAKVKKFESHPINGRKKYIIYIDGNPIELSHEVQLGSSNPMAVRATKYTTLEKLKKANEFSEL